MTTALYVHIPFCAAKCNYCAFTSYVGLESLQDRYIDALAIECERVLLEQQGQSLKTIFLGGGTPSILSAAQLQKLFALIADTFRVAPDAEVSVELNPGTIGTDKLEVLQACGVNRLSVGVQSFIDQELQTIGRIHSASEAAVAVKRIQDIGFTNVSIDLMYGLPKQSSGSWQQSLETALSTDVQHLSLYQLTVEEHTPLQAMIENKQLCLPGEEEIEKMDKITASLLGEVGFTQYEISNYAKTSYQCRHNINYWHNGSYYGLGAGAVSYLQGRRVKNLIDPLHYCHALETGKSIISEEECLGPQDAFKETVIMGLRMDEGVSIERLEKRFGMDLEQVYGRILESLCANNLLKRSGSHLLLTDKGRGFANQVMAELV